MKNTNRSLSAATIVHINENTVFRGRKFYLEYQFASRGRELRFRGLEVYVQEDNKEGEALAFFYPSRGYWYTFPEGLKKTDIPPSIRNIKTRADITVPVDVLDKAVTALELRVVQTLTKT